MKQTAQEALERLTLEYFLFPKELFSKMNKSSQNDYLLEEEFGLDNTTKYREAVGFIEGFTEGTKWQQEKSYSEEEVLELLRKYQDKFGAMGGNSFFVTEWFEQFKKK